jgi:hypothetical protein
MLAKEEKKSIGGKEERKGAHGVSDGETLHRRMKGI